MNKYIAYCRKSTDEKDQQVLSIEAQIAELKKFCQNCQNPRKRATCASAKEN